LAATDGQIRDTAFDSSDFLSYLLLNSAAQASRAGSDNQETIDRLTQRINNTAFVILEAIKRSSAVATVATTTGG